MTNMALSPASIKVFLPAFSIRMRDTTVIRTFIEPMPKVAPWLSCSLRPAFSKMSVE